MQYSGTEVFFDRDDLIVSKTNLKGHITYANHTFLDIAGYDESEVIGKPHNIIRHKNMPGGVFEFFWKVLSEEKEIFAYVVNSTKNGDYYWVIAHVTPSFSDGRVNGYHSTRRVPDPHTIREVIEPLYDKLNNVEASSTSKKEGIQSSFAHLNDILAEKGATYNEFVAATMKGN